MSIIIDMNDRTSDNRFHLHDTEVTIGRLQKVLTDALIECERDPDEDLYVTDGIAFPIWVCTDEDRKLILFTTYVTGEDDAHSIPLERVNELNATLILVRFSGEGTTLRCNFWMTYDGGLCTRQFVKMVRLFAGCFHTAINEMRDELQRNAPRRLC